MSASRFTTKFLALSALGAALSARVALGARSEDEAAASKKKAAASNEAGECEDKDTFSSGITNSMGWGCSLYSKAMCVPRFDTEDFKADDMCCVCGGGYRTPLVSEDLPCPATCHGYTCDEWVNNGGGNTCRDLEDKFFCDCSGCTCAEYPQDSYNDGAVTNANYYDGEEDSRPQQVDPMSNYWAAGSGYCAGANGESVDYHRLRGTVAENCAWRCNTEAGCLAFAVDDFGCVVYYVPVAQGNGEEGAWCYIRAASEHEQTSIPTKVVDTKPEDQQPHGQTKEVEMKPVSGHNQPLDVTKEMAEEWKGENTMALHGPNTVDLGGKTVAGISYKPLGAVDADMAQVFEWVEKKSTFFLKRRFEPPASCVDSDDQCPQFASDGYCTVPENSEWMTANCRFSCGACAPVIEAPPNHVVAKFTKSFFSFHGVVEVNLLGRMYKLMKPNVINVQTTWRVALLDGKVLFSVQKGECRKRKDGCDQMWQIFQGLTRQKKVVYFGIQRTSTFKLYASAADFERDPANGWRAEIRMLVPSKKEPASYRVTVMPGDDSGLILLSAYLINHSEDLVPDRGTSDTEGDGQ